MGKERRTQLRHWLRLRLPRRRRLRLPQEEKLDSSRPTLNNMWHRRHRCPYERILPEGGVLPWWVVLVFSVYSLLKLGMTLEHPCGVLGTHAPVTRSQIQKAYRSLSVCTHPDKLVGFETEDVRRGELLFKRASSARESLIAELRSASQSKPCQEAKARRQEAAAAAAAAPEPARRGCAGQHRRLTTRVRRDVLDSAAQRFGRVYVRSLTLLRRVASRLCTASSNSV